MSNSAFVISMLVAFGMFGGLIGGTLMYELRGRAQAESIIQEKLLETFAGCNQ